MEPFSYTLYLYTHVCMHAYSYQYVLYVYIQPMMHVHSGCIYIILIHASMFSMHTCIQAHIKSWNLTLVTYACIQFCRTYIYVHKQHTVFFLSLVKVWCSVMIHISAWCYTYIVEKCYHGRAHYSYNLISNAHLLLNAIFSLLILEEKKSLGLVLWELLQNIRP